MTDARPLPRRKMWIPTCFNSITIEIFEKVNLSYFVKVMKNFSPKVSLDLKMQKFFDENCEAEQLIELLGYYKIDRVITD